jgi:hypothetical protein
VNRVILQTAKRRAPVGHNGETQAIDHSHRRGNAPTLPDTHAEALTHLHEVLTGCVARGIGIKQKPRQRERDIAQKVDRRWKHLEPLIQKALTLGTVDPDQIETWLPACLLLSGGQEFADHVSARLSELEIAWVDRLTPAEMAPLFETYQQKFLALYDTNHQIYASLIQTKNLIIQADPYALSLNLCASFKKSDLRDALQKSIARALGGVFANETLRALVHFTLNPNVETCKALLLIFSQSEAEELRVQNLVIRAKNLARQERLAQIHALLDAQETRALDSLTHLPIIPDAIANLADGIREQFQQIKKLAAADFSDPELQFLKDAAAIHNPRQMYTTLLSFKDILPAWRRKSNLIDACKRHGLTALAIALQNPKTTPQEISIAQYATRLIESGRINAAPVAEILRAPDLLANLEVAQRALEQACADALTTQWRTESLPPDPKTTTPILSKNLFDELMTLIPESFVLESRFRLWPREIHAVRWLESHYGKAVLDKLLIFTQDQGVEKAHAESARLFLNAVATLLEVRGEEVTPAQLFGDLTPTHLFLQDENFVARLYLNPRTSKHGSAHHTPAIAEFCFAARMAKLTGGTYVYNPAFHVQTALALGLAVGPYFMPDGYDPATKTIYEVKYGNFDAEDVVKFEKQLKNYQHLVGMGFAISFELVIIGTDSDNAIDAVLFQAQKLGYGSQFRVRVLEPGSMRLISTQMSP